MGGGERARNHQLCGAQAMKPALILAAVLAVTAGLLALIDTHRGPDWDDYRDQLKERL